MKKIVLVALLLSAFTAGVFARGKKPVSFEKVPAAVQEVVQQNFTPLEIQLITAKKIASRKYVYAFSMDEGTQLKYTNKAVLLEVKNEKGIRTSFVPEKILTYVQETFPNATITRYEAATGKKVVELNDEMELVFTKKGKFLRIED